MEAYEKNLHINDSAFEGMRKDVDHVLQRLIKNMVEKDSLEGKINITIDVCLRSELIPNRDPNIEADNRRVLIPKISHKVGSVMQIKNEAKGDMNYDGMELVWDEEKGEYVLKPIANTDQMTIFDEEFQCVNDVEDSEAEVQPALEGRRVAALLAPAEEVPEEVDEAEDLSEQFSTDDDDYEYEEPEEI